MHSLSSLSFMLLAHRTKIAAALSVALSLYWVALCWGIWNAGPLAMGLNYMIFTLGIAALFAVHAGDRVFTWPHLRWLIPVVLIALSFFLYENPFVKLTHVLVLPILFACYRVSVSTRNYGEVFWNWPWINHLIERFFGAVLSVGPAINAIVRTVLPFDVVHGNTARKVIIGLAIFIGVAIVVFIPLLTAADPAFADLIWGIRDWVVSLLSMEGIMRIIFFFGVSAGLLAITLRWNTHGEFHTDKKAGSMDDIISGIVLGGILFLYVLFLFTQLQSLWVERLPVEFSETEVLVKTGFWQLFVLSVINVALFVAYYRRTKSLVQNILIAFTLTSLLLLFSAGHRMWLYVYTYGFSYEKLFAAYTVDFMFVLFVYLIWSLFTHARKDIVRFLAYAFVWMYAVIVVFPVEQFIFRANRYLSSLPGSRIDMLELQMLSADVYGLIKEANESKPNVVWEQWMKWQDVVHANKEWYEWTLQDVKISMKETPPALPVE